MMHNLELLIQPIIIIAVLALSPHITLIILFIIKNKITN